MVDQNEKGLKAAAGQVRGTAIVGDLRDRSLLPDLVAAAAREMQGIDGVVNCAGVSAGLAFADTTDDAWDETVRVNLEAPFFLIRAALPWLMEREPASVVNVASGAGILPDMPGVAAYAASKGGLIALTKALAAELAPRIRVNAVSPGLTRTGLTHSLLDGYGPGVTPPFAQRYALKRAAQPDEIASAIVYLLSDDSSFVTGSTLSVDGGRSYH
jgi:NAD(P)-dependent dehydrogenase (short-subunit alcohol dehydrogenase family)